MWTVVGMEPEVLLAFPDRIRVYNDGPLVLEVEQTPGWMNVFDCIAANLFNYFLGSFELVTSGFRSGKATFPSIIDFIYVPLSRAARIELCCRPGITRSGFEDWMTYKDLHDVIPTSFRIWTIRCSSWPEALQVRIHQGEFIIGNHGGWVLGENNTLCKEGLPMIHLRLGITVELPYRAMMDLLLNR